MTDEDSEDERDIELSSIAAIFPELELGDKQNHAATLSLDITPANPVSITQKLELEDTHIPITVNLLRHLPPLELSIQLPKGYPEDQPPNFVLNSSSSWIPESTIDRLTREGHSLWEEYGKSQVVYAYIDFLQQEAERAFGLGQDVAQPLLVSATQREKLLQFDRDAAQKRFNDETFECGVCLEPKKGSACYKLRRCGHVFCVSCLQDFYNSAIAEGDVSAVKCLDTECGVKNLNAAARRSKKRPTLHPTELLKIPLEEGQVQRYMELKTKKKLESDKSTIYCPRTWCQGPARSPKYKKYNVKDDLADFPESDSEDEATSDATSAPSIPAANSTDRLTICSHCAFAFCRRCFKSWHGDLTFCLPPPSTIMTAEEKASYDYIRLHTSPCPTCGSPCQKTHGCNHMSCPTCKSHFCYLCSAWLQPQDPYIHFNTIGAPCYMRLWDLEEGDDGTGGVGGFGGPRAAEWANAVLDGRVNGHGDEVNVVGGGHVGVGVGGAGPAIAAEPRPAARPAVPAGHQGPINEAALQRFIQLALMDEEEGWDSDDLGEEGGFIAYA